MADKPSIRRLYALSNTPYHLFQRSDSERLWLLLRDESFRRQQLELLHRYRESYMALELGLRLYTEERNGSEPDDDPRLCWLVMRASRMAHEASTNYGSTFEQAETLAFDDPDRITRVIGQFEHLNQKQLFLALILLLWIEADRAKEISRNARRTTGIMQILGVFAEKFVEAPIDWTAMLKPDLLVLLGKHLTDIFGSKINSQLEHTFFRSLWRMLDAIPRRRNDASVRRAEFVSSLASHHFFTLSLNLATSRNDDMRCANAMTIVDHLLSAGDLERAQHACEQLSSFFSTQDRLRFNVAHEAYRLGHFDTATKLTSEIQDPNLQVRLLVYAGSRLVKNGRHSEAELIFSAARVVATRSERDSVGYRSTSPLANRVSMILRATWELGIYNDALWKPALNEIDSLNSHTRTKTLKTIASFLAEIDDFDNAFAVAGMMDRESGGWWCETISTISKALANRRTDRPHAQGLLREALEAARSIYWCKPDALAAVAESLVVCEEIETGSKIFAEAVRAIGRPFKSMEWQYAETLDNIFLRLCDAPPFPNRNHLMLRVLDLRRNLSADLITQTLPSLTKAALQTKECGNTHELLDKIVELSIESCDSSTSIGVSLVEIIEILCDAQRFGEANRLAEMLPFNRVGCFSALGQSLAEKGEQQRALVAFLKAFQEAQRTLLLQEMPEEFLELIARMSRSGFPIQALILTRHLENLDLRLLATSVTLSDILHHHGSLHARRAFQSTIFQPTSLVRLDFRAQANIAIELARLGNTQHTIVIVHSALKAAAKLSSNEAVDSLIYIVNAIQATWQLFTGDAKLFELARKLIDGLKARQDHARKILLSTFICTGDLNHATTLAKEIAGAFERAEALALVARGWIVRGAFEQASVQFGEALEAARAHDSKLTPAQARVAQYLVEAGSFPGRNDLLRSALVDVAQRGLDSDKAEAVKKVTRELLKASDVLDLMDVLEQAQDVIEETEMRHLEDLRIEIAGALARSGHARRALKLAEKLPRMQRAHAQSMTAIVLGLVERGDLLEALRLLPEITDEWARAHAGAKLGDKLLYDKSQTLDRPAIFRELIDLTCGIRNFVKSLETLQLLAQSALSSGALAEVRDLIAHKLAVAKAHENECRNEPERNSFRCNTVRLLVLLHEVPRAIRFVSQTEPEEWGFYYNNLAMQLADTPMTPWIRDLLPEISNGVRNSDHADTQAKALVSLALIYAKIGEFDHSYNYLEQSFRTKSDSCSLSPFLKLAKVASEYLNLSLLWQPFIAQVGTLSTQLDQEELLTKLAPLVANLGGDSEAIAALSADNIANSARQSFILSWRAELSRMGAEGRLRLRRSLAAFPFEDSLGIRGVYSYLEQCLRCGDREAFEAVYELCSELGLEGLGSSGSQLG